MKTYFVDSFTDEPFKGNPAGVCFPEKSLGNDQMQKIAKEIGFSETAFVRPLETGGVYSIRFFSPKQEIPLCGHATLASAKIIFDTTGISGLLFITGELVKLKIGRAGDSILMEFPVYDTQSQTVPDSMLAALGVTEITRASYSPQNKIIILEIASSQILGSLHPDFGALTDSYQGINGVLVTAPSESPDFDFHYRYFWPWAGTNEDPVTGGVQTFLAKYWALKLNKKRLKAFQSSERTGFMTVEWQDEKVLISGQAVIVFEGSFRDP